MTIKLQDIYGLAAVDIGGPIQLHDPAKTYTAGDIVVQGGTIYQAKGAVPTGAFDATQWNHAVWDKDIRDKIYADLDLYVRPGGNDANEGLIDDDAHALASINAALDRLTDYDLGAYNATINVAAGDYTDQVLFNHSLLGGKQIRIKGAGAASTTIAAIYVYQPSNIVVDALKILHPTGGLTFISGYGSKIKFTNCTFDFATLPGPDPVFRSMDGGSLTLSNCTLDYAGKTVNAMVQSAGGYFAFDGVTTCVGNLTVNWAYIFCQNQGYVFNYSGTFTGGTVTGKKYNVEVISLIYTNNRPNIFPGSAAGSADAATFGVYK